MPVAGGITCAAVECTIQFALASAYNDHVLNKWARRYECFKGSIAARDADSAAAEIRRLGSEVGMVQVHMSSAARIPMDNKTTGPFIARHVTSIFRSASTSERKEVESRIRHPLLVTWPLILDSIRTIRKP